MPSASETFLSACRKVMRLTGDAALKNVSYAVDGSPIFDSSGAFIKGRFPRGGPFGATLALFNERGEAEILGAPCVNAVMESGIASRHAEHEALSPANLQLLSERLRAAKAKKEKRLAVLFASAQPCPTCQTKIEIVARFLAREGLLPLGRFLSVYGMSYDETEKLASFNDRGYACALRLASGDSRHAGSLLRRRFCPIEDAPENIRLFFAKASKKNVAAVVRENEIYATGTDARTPMDRFATAEVSAIRNACLAYRKEGHKDSWTVEGTLYTPCAEMGPLLFSEAAWTGIKDLVHVALQSEPPGLQEEMRETEELSNTAFLRLLADGYEQEGLAARVFRSPSPPDEAHKTWGAMVNCGLLKPYNGLFAAQFSDKERKTAAERFAAPEITTFDFR